MCKNPELERDLERLSNSVFFFFSDKGTIARLSRTNFNPFCSEKSLGIRKYIHFSDRLVQHFKVVFYFLNANKGSEEKETKKTVSFE